MAILLTGGTGKTSSRVSRLLQSANKNVILASRNPRSAATATSESVKFDYFDPSTYENAFKTKFGDVESVYLVAPNGAVEVFDTMKPFIDFAREKGVKRFVLLSASTFEPGGPSIGKVHEYISQLGVDYTVVRPTWFIDNFATSFAPGIKMNNEIVTASADGKVGFVAADDIAEAVFDALTVEKSYNTDFIILGPELLSHDQVAETFSSVLGRTVKHTRLTPEELTKRYLAAGSSEEHAALLVAAEGMTASGVEEKVWAIPPPKKRNGKKTLKQFVEENKVLWEV